MNNENLFLDILISSHNTYPKLCDKFLSIYNNNQQYKYICQVSIQDIELLIESDYNIFPRNNSYIITSYDDNEKYKILNPGYHIYDTENKQICKHKALGYQYQTLGSCAYRLENESDVDLITRLRQKYELIPIERY